MILVDSSVWVAYFNGVQTRETDYLDDALGRDLLATGDLILTEVLQGFRTDAGHKTARRLLLTLPVFEMVGRRRALKAAGNYRKLRRAGVTIRKTIDVLIATFCIEEGHTLLFTDRDFDPCVEHLGLKTAVG